MTMSVSARGFCEGSEAHISTQITTTHGVHEKNCKRHNSRLSGGMVLVQATTAGMCIFTKFNLFSLKYEIKLL